MASVNKTVVKTNTTITFAISCNANDSIQVELDTDLNGDKSCFLYGDTAWFRIFTSPLDMQFTIDVTAGSICEGSPELNTLTDQEETLEFVEEIEANTARPILNLLEARWLGNNLGTITKSGVSSLKAAVKGLGVMKVKYESQYHLRGLTLQDQSPETEFPVIVLIKQVKTA
jgi:hypothetical protein